MPQIKDWIEHYESLPVETLLKLQSAWLMLDSDDMIRKNYGDTSTHAYCITCALPRESTRH